MGEFEEDPVGPQEGAGGPGRGREGAAGGAGSARDVAADGPGQGRNSEADGPSALPSDVAPAGGGTWRVRARHRLDEGRILEVVEPGSVEAERVLALHESMKQRARLYAAHLERLSEFFREDPAVQGVLDDADLTAMKVATGLRCTYLQAQAQVLDAHRAVEWMPFTFAVARSGDLPEAWHLSLLRHVRRLDEAQVRQVDEHLAGVELSSVSKATFDKQVLLAVELATAGTLPTPPSRSRNAEVVDVNTETGTASLCVTGPIPEIQALAHRLDVAARTVQTAQRTALENEGEGPFPFDIDEDLAERGKALSLATLRYAILTHSVLDIDPVQETRSPYKILVTVPVTTLLGMQDAPAMLEGLSPIPAEQARVLAAGASTWQRILTDPLTGAHLPVTADTYQPTQQMRLQLRLRHPICAAPGCHRRTVLAAEDDHIIEYDHTHPDQGGQTSLWNLHRLCWLHHGMKTAGWIDPDRDPHDDPTQGDGTTTAAPLETTWRIGDAIRARTREHTDLLTPHMVEHLETAWRTYQRHHEDAQRLHEEEKARPRTERAAEQRLDALKKAHPGRYGRRTDRRVIPPGTTYDESTPPF